LFFGPLIGERIGAHPLQTIVQSIIQIREEQQLTDSSPVGLLISRISAGVKVMPWFCVRVIKSQSKAQWKGLTVEVAFTSISPFVWWCIRWKRDLAFSLRIRS
jgi:hypothetical protein